MPTLNPDAPAFNPQATPYVARNPHLSPNPSTNTFTPSMWPNRGGTTNNTPPVSSFAPVLVGFRRQKQPPQQQPTSRNAQASCMPPWQPPVIHGSDPCMGMSTGQSGLVETWGSPPPVNRPFPRQSCGMDIPIMRPRSSPNMNQQVPPPPSSSRPGLSYSSPNPFPIDVNRGQIKGQQSFTTPPTAMPPGGVAAASQFTRAPQGASNPTPGYTASQQPHRTTQGSAPSNTVAPMNKDPSSRRTTQRIAIVVPQPLSVQRAARAEAAGEAPVGLPPQGSCSQDPVSATAGVAASVSGKQVSPSVARERLEATVNSEPYIPKGWNPPLHTRSAPNRNAQSSPQVPIVVLLFGNRGSGKTVQSERLAIRYNLLHVSSGTLFRDGKKPFVELHHIVMEHFDSNKDRKYRGLVLDRFIVTSEVDAYYIQHALDEAHLPVPMAFWLQVDPKVGLERAKTRGDSKKGLDYWRIVEQRAQTITATTVYDPIGCLKRIDSERLTVDEVTAEIEREIDIKFAKHSRNIRLPALKPIAGGDDLPLISNYTIFSQVSGEVHLAIGNTQGRNDSSPLSNICGYLDRGCFAHRNRGMRSLLCSMHVSLKADGQRFLVFKHKAHGILGIPHLFNCCYDFNPLFGGTVTGTECAPKAESAPDSTTLTTEAVEWVLDTELCVNKGKLVLYVMDYLNLFGVLGTSTLFHRRLCMLREFFANVERLSTPEAKEACRVELKDYTPIHQLAQLLPRFDEAPFSIDGIIFQHNGVYHCGPDKCIYKWKPKHLCTVDFRLMNGRQLDKDGSWEFDLYVCGTAPGNSIDELPFAGATALITQEEVNAHQLGNSIIAELSLSSVSMQPSKSKKTTWVFHRNRSDKPSPNKGSIAANIVNMDHLHYDELLELCAKVQFRLH